MLPFVLDYFYYFYNILGAVDDLQPEHAHAQHSLGYTVPPRKHGPVHEGRGGSGGARKPINQINTLVIPEKKYNNCK